MERRIGSMVVAWGLMLGCGDGATSRPEPGESTTGDEVATTIPPTTLTTTIGGDGSSDDGSNGDASSGETSGDDATSTTSDSGAASTSTAGDDSTSGSTGETSLDLQWCNLQYPPTIPQPDESPTYDPIVTPGEATTVYTRVYVVGLTDTTEFVDESDVLVAEVGYGPEGSDPEAETWTWIAASGNPGWDGTMADGFGQENNDEYVAELSFAEPGTFDYAARYSIDGGSTYVYCDLDGFVEGGYTPDQAGAAEIVAAR